MMNLRDKAGVITEAAKHRLAERHAENLERENQRLKVENSTLRDQSDQDRDRMERLLNSLDDVTAKPKKHRLRRLMTLTVAAGGAYMMGAKAGRERYEQMKGWWADRRTRGVDRVNEWGEDVTSRAGDAVQSATQKATERVSGTGDSVSRKVDQATAKAAGTVEETGTKASKAVEDAGNPRIG